MIDLIASGTIDTSPSSIRTFAIIVLGLIWVYIFSHPDDED